MMPTLPARAEVVKTHAMPALCFVFGCLPEGKRRCRRRTAAANWRERSAAGSEDCADSKVQRETPKVSTAGSLAAGGRTARADADQRSPVLLELAGDPEADL
jgi:hypothetical protein